MKSIKKILLSTLAIATLVLCLALTSCGGCEHTWGEWEATGEATCTGTPEKRVCSACQEEETRTNTDAVAHSFGEWEAAGEAACAGTPEKRVCSACQAEETRTNAAIVAHTWGEWEATGEPTCDGTAEKRVCSACQAEESRVNGDSTAHSFGAWVATGAATCAGTPEKRVCSACQAEETRTNADAVAHSFGAWTANGAATCTGTPEKRVCANCPAEETRTNSALTAHTWGAWSTTTPATCTEDGEKARACTLCPATETDTIDALDHVGATFCENCGETLFTFPEIDLSGLDSLAINIAGLEIAMDTPSRPYSSGTLTADVAEGYVSLDADGNLVGFFKAVLNMKNTTTGVDKDMSIIGFIENNAIYVGAEGFGMDGITPSNTHKMNNYAKFDIASASHTDFAEMEALLAQAEALLPELEAWYADFAEIFADVAIDDSAIKTLAVRALNALLVRTETEDGYTLGINYEGIKAFIVTLSETKISDVIDILFGEGAYADIKALITSDEFYSFSVADLISYIETEQGIDLAELLASLDDLTATVMGSEEATFLALISAYGGMELPPDFDLVAYLKSDEMATLSVMEALKMIIPVEPDDPATEEIDEAAEEIKAGFAQIFEMLEAASLFDLMMASGPKEEVEPLSVSEENPYAEMIEMINDSIDQMSELSTIVLYFDKEGAYVKTVLTGGMYAADQEMAVTLTIGTEDITVDVDYVADIDDTAGVMDISVQLIPGETVAEDAAAMAKIKTMLAKFPGFQNATEYFNAVLGEFLQDYSDVYRIQDNTLTILRINGVKNFGDSAYIDAIVYTFEYFDGINSIQVIEACSDKIGVTLTIPQAYAKGEFEIIDLPQMNDWEYTGYIVNTFFAVDANFQAVVDSIPAEAWMEEEGTLEFLYDTETKDYTWDFNNYFGYGNPEFEYNGHNYVLDLDNSVLSDICDTIIKYVYKCSVCGDEFTYYTKTQHQLYNSDISLKNEDAGIAGGFEVHKDCYNDGCDGVTIDLEIASELDLAVEDFGDNDFLYLTFTIADGDEGEYRFYSESEGDTDPEIALYLFDGDELSDDYLFAEDDTNGMDFDREYYLGAGTYAIVIYFHRISGDSVISIALAD